MLFDEILEQLLKDYNNRITQDEMAKKYNVTQNVIQRILSDNEKLKGMRLETIQKMFPTATIHSSSNNVIQGAKITHNAGHINSNNNNFLSQEKDNFIKEISSKVLNHEKLSDSEKIKFLQILNEK